MQFLQKMFAIPLIFRWKVSRVEKCNRIYPNNNMKRERLTLVSFIRDLASRSRNVCDESSLLDTGTRFMRANLRNRADYDQDFPFVFVSLLVVCPWHSSCGYHRVTAIDHSWSDCTSKPESRNIFKWHSRYDITNILVFSFCTSSDFDELFQPLLWLKKFFVGRRWIICRSNLHIE